MFQFEVSLRQRSEVKLMIYVPIATELYLLARPSDRRLSFNGLIKKEG
jgi:hypothetical protein